MTLKKIIAVFCALLFGAAPANATFEYYGQSQYGYATMYRATCAVDNTTLSSFTYTDITISGQGGQSPGDRVLVVVGLIGEDSATVFDVTSATADGVSLTEQVDDAGVQIVSTAIYSGFITWDGAVTIVANWSEALSSGAEACVWVIRGARSATATSSNHANTAAGAALTLTTATTELGGFVFGVSNSSSVANTTTWTVLTEIEDADSSFSSYSNADATATGASMSVTADWSGSASNSGSTAAFR